MAHDTHRDFVTKKQNEQKLLNSRCTVLRVNKAMLIPEAKHFSFSRAIENTSAIN